MKMYFSNDIKRFEAVAGVLNAISYDPEINYYRVEFRGDQMTIVRWGGEFGGNGILSKAQIAEILKAANQAELLDAIKGIVTDYRFIENTTE